jgi:hypothetical protein
MTAERLLSRLDHVKPVGRGRWRARCPSHGSRGGTLAIREESDGRVLVHCHALCPVEAVLGAVGLDFDALFPEKPIEGAKWVKRPWRASDVVHALEFELQIAFIFLGDVAHGRPITDADRDRALECQERVARFLEEFWNAA